jgi:hypothetical protein
MNCAGHPCPKGEPPRRRPLASLACAALLLALLATSPPAHACAPAPPHGEVVHTSREDALIVWDAEHKTEHFIRSAVFGTGAASFGFLVPTPTRPTLAEASDAAIDDVATLTQAAVVRENHYVLAPIGCTMLPVIFRTGSSSREGYGEPTAGVLNVLEETRVAGMDAAVLEASSTAALAGWLGDHGFEFRDALQRWVAPYVAAHWKITAFRYARREAARGDMPSAVAGTGTGTDDPIASRAVRLSFPVDAPIYPYREPDDTADVPGRELRLFVLSDSKLDGLLSDAPGTPPWPAEVSFSAKAAVDARVAKALPGVDLPAEVWINEYSDRSSRRALSDVVFRPSASPGEIRRPPVVAYDDIPIPIPYELPFLALGVHWFRSRRRRRMAPRP